MSKSTLTRRALVASTAAVPAAAALGLPAVAQAAAEPDPAFALIEEYRRAYAQHGAALDARRLIPSWTVGRLVMLKHMLPGSCAKPRRPLSAGSPLF